MGLCRPAGPNTIALQHLVNQGIGPSTNTTVAGGAGHHALCEPVAAAHDHVLRLDVTRGVGVTEIGRIVTGHHIGVGRCLATPTTQVVHLILVVALGRGTGRRLPVGLPVVAVGLDRIALLSCTR